MHVTELAYEIRAVVLTGNGSLQFLRRIYLASFASISPFMPQKYEQKHNGTKMLKFSKDKG